jgi:leucine dehydrogenase
MSTIVTDTKVDNYERVVRVENDAAQLFGFIAIHDTVLGPALGGVRHRAYQSGNEALEEVKELAYAMTMKNSLAGINYGGGKSVIMGVPSANRRDLYLAMGEAIEQLGGIYIGAGDVGTSKEDLLVTKEATSYIGGVERDSGPDTAKGVFYAIEAYAEHYNVSLEGMRVAISGVGKVGNPLAHYLFDAGCELFVADVLETAFAPLQKDNIKYTRVLTSVVPEIPCEIFAPCSLGHVINRNNRRHLNSIAIIGAANNQMDSAETVRWVFNQGFVYGPDFLVNAGGVISIAAELEHWKDDYVEELLTYIGDRMRDVLEKAEDVGMPEIDIATEVAWNRIRSKKHNFWKVMGEGE